MSVSSGLVSMISSHGSHFLASLHAWLFLAVCWAFLYLQIFWSFALRCSRYLETVWFFLVFAFKICRWDPVCVQSSAECFPLWVLSSVPSGLSRGWFPSLGWFPHIPVLSSTQPNTFTVSAVRSSPVPCPVNRCHLFSLGLSALSFQFRDSIGFHPNSLPWAVAWKPSPGSKPGHR